MSAEQALHLLNMHKHQVHGLGGRPGRRMDYAKQLEEARQRLEKVMRGLKLIPRDEEEVRWSGGRPRKADREKRDGRSRE
jgi:hypothetical protein